MLTAECQMDDQILSTVPSLGEFDEALDTGHPGTATRVLLIDEYPRRMSDGLRKAFPTPQYRVQLATSGPGAQLANFRADTHDVAVLCLNACTPSGLELYHQVRRLDPRLPVICVGSAGRADLAIETIKQGAYDFLFHPIEPTVLRRVAGEATAIGRSSARESDTGVENEHSESEGLFVGRCAAMAEVYKSIGRVADQNVIVLITGESGTGKELVARAIHQHSRRADRPFLAINCAAIPESLLESELFGHEKGAFTGADRRRIGKFEQCNGGTIFLDEIGDMPLATQGKILRLLQDQKFERVGGNETIQTDVRVITATNRDLKAFSEQGKFRPDLYYRLSVFTIRLPPLRERGEDLPMLINYYLRRFSPELARDVREVAPETMQRLRGYSWPGNIRELQSVVKRALLHASGSVLIPAFLPELSSHETADASKEDWAVFREFIHHRLESGSRELDAEAQLQVDRVLLPTVLEFTDANQFRAAKILGLSRQTLRHRLRNIGRTVTKSFGGFSV